MIKIRKNGHPALSSMAEPIEVGSDVSALLASMWDTMYHHKGIGLAANQIGELKRVIVIHAKGFKQELINPVIVKRGKAKDSSKEGCLSFPGMEVTMIRHKSITVEGYDRDWNPIRRKLNGLAAFCVQHEVDHLDGKTIAINTKQVA